MENRFKVKRKFCLLASFRKIWNTALTTLRLLFEGWVGFLESDPNFRMLLLTSAKQKNIPITDRTQKFKIKQIKQLSEKPEIF